MPLPGHQMQQNDADADMGTPLLHSESSNQDQLPEQQTVHQAFYLFLNTICFKREHLCRLPPLMTEETRKRWQKHEYAGQKEYQLLVKNAKIIISVYEKMRERAATEA